MRSLKVKVKYSSTKTRNNIMEVTRQIYNSEIEDTQRAINAIRSTVQKGPDKGKGDNLTLA